ncbi:MAG: hypothetical protein EZS28_032186 [Streblomastix strix]|uniref:Protein kinase domain-containing protein n=1 Tax=Streblomastix strix TaxID=222440 RepID=A0A5J4UPC9_9EUKA|nr:MAG: hypothetical protein EZS28_032186 [Streblomastix strix]
MEPQNRHIITGPICIGEIVASTFMTERLLSAGKQSTVFQARSKHRMEGNRVALKIIPIGNGQQTLDNDIAVLKCIGGQNHFAKLNEIGSHRQFQFLAMELLGPTLCDILKRPQKSRFSLSSVAKVGIQCLEALSTLHKAGFVHRKIRSEKILIGHVKETSGNIFLIDFKQSQRIKDQDTKIKLVQNDLHYLLKMLMALYRGVEDV